MKNNAKVFSLFDETPETAEEALRLFVSWKRAAGASPRTIQGYVEIIRDFFSRYPLAWSSTCAPCVLSYLGQEGIAPATYNFRLKALSPFFQFCVEKNVFERSPTEGMKRRRAEPRIVDHSKDEMNKILSQMDCAKFTGMRDTALFVLSLDTGIRPSEALQLTLLDIDLKERKVFIPAAIAKTRKARMVYFSRDTAKALGAMIAMRKKEWAGSVPFFCTSEGKPWNTHAWTVRLQRYAKSAGIRRFSAYDLRHNHAIQFLRNGGEFFGLSREMGHSNLEMTKGYLAFSDEDLRKNHERASPVASLLSHAREMRGGLRTEDSLNRRRQGK